MEVLPLSPLWAPLHLLTLEYGRSLRVHTQFLFLFILCFPPQACGLSLTCLHCSSFCFSQHSYAKKPNFSTLPHLFPSSAFYTAFSGTHRHSIFSSILIIFFPIILPLRAPTWLASPPSLQHCRFTDLGTLLPLPDEHCLLS